jgi:hypothetical protein
LLVVVVAAMVVVVVLVLEERVAVQVATETTLRLIQVVGVVECVLILTVEMVETVALVLHLCATRR